MGVSKEEQKKKRRGGTSARSLGEGEAILQGEGTASKKSGHCNNS